MGIIEEDVIAGEMNEEVLAISAQVGRFGRCVLFHGMDRAFQFRIIDLDGVVGQEEENVFILTKAHLLNTIPDIYFSFCLHLSYF